MIELLNIFGFLSVLLRAMTLACGSLAAGGILFTLICLPREDSAALAACRRLIFWSAAALAFGQSAFIATDAAILQATVDLPFADVVSANFFLAGVASALAALTCMLLVRRLRQGSWFMLIPVAVILGAELMTSHAAARVDHQTRAILLTGLHQGATMAWIGGLPFLLLTLVQSRTGMDAARAGARFSRLAQFSIAGIAFSGIGLSYSYIGSVPGLYGTSYGIMVAGKALMFGIMLALGGANLFIVRGLKRGPEALLARLKRLSEAEIGIGFTVVLAAASLTSQAPPIDLQTGRVTPPEIVERFTPRAPRLQSPQLNELSPPSLPTADVARADSFVPGAVTHPNTPGDIAWSEYNHNWAGLAVLLMGVLAVASRIFRLRWARHWPLAFFGLAFFLLLRADPEAWPLGPKGFWYSMTDSEVLQHRLFALMIIAFAFFEWSVQVGRIKSHAAALVFPGVCALGGALLMTHSHALGNVKEEYMAEVSHLSIAIFAVAAGWARWLEQRVDAAWRRIPSTVWPVCFVLIGLMLLFYREA